MAAIGLDTVTTICSVREDAQLPGDPRSSVYPSDIAGVKQMGPEDAVEGLLAAADAFNISVHLGLELNADGFSGAHANLSASFFVHDVDRIIWSAALTRMASRYWQRAFGDALLASFPNATISNFGMYQWDQEHCVPSSAGGLGCRAGSGAVGLNAQAPIFYPNFVRGTATRLGSPGTQARTWAVSA